MEQTNLDMDSMIEQIRNALIDEVEDAVEEAAEDIASMLPEIVKESLEQSLTEFRFRLPDGTEVIPRQRLKVLSPDKTLQLICYGGLRVRDTRQWKNIPDGWGLEIQTRVSCWEFIAVYPEKKEAVAALQKVSEAMETGKTFLALE